MRDADKLDVPLTANLHTDQPSAARMYDYCLGGKDNLAVDRAAVDRVTDSIGVQLTKHVVQENRQFLSRAVQYLVRDAGIRQIIDIGAGLPTQENTHQVAQESDPNVRVVYVDNDATVLVHGRALLAENASTRVITADMREPDTILNHPDLTEMINWSEPVGILFVAVLHFVRDAEDPAGIVAAFRDKAASGSLLALTHLTTDGPSPGKVKAVEAVYEEATSPMVFRPRDEIESFFAGWDLVDPGVVRPWEWRVAKPPVVRTDWLYAGIGQKP